MGGKKPIKVYEYAFNGEYIKSYDNINEFRRLNYPDDKGKRPLFNYKFREIKYHMLEDSIAFIKRPGREAIRLVIAIHNSQYCKQTEYDNPIEVFNLKGEKIAEFKNQRLLNKLLPQFNDSIINRQLKSTRKQCLNNMGLYFKYKEDGR